MDFSNQRRLKTNNSLQIQNEINENDIFQGYSKRISEGSQDTNSKNVLIIYASGSMAANKNLEIERGELQKNMSENFYLCELEHTKKCFPKLEYLITPILENGTRIQYKVIELERIESSINMIMEDIANISKIIYQNYQKYNSFIVVTGLDTICHVGTVLSFMLENLSKLVLIEHNEVICTGGYLPLSHMRNDCVCNLLECLSVCAEGSNMCDVLIVNKNKGYRANRCIKMKEGDFENIASPNLLALCSIKTKIRARSSLFRPVPDADFSIFTEMSRYVKILRLNQFECLESLEYELKNPHIKGFVILSFSFANMPDSPELLNLFKNAHEDKKTIFINVSEAISSKNESVMKLNLEQYHIYFGSDMTVEAALAKLSYLIGKGFPEKHIIKLMNTNMRGELTEEKDKVQFKRKEVGAMQIVQETLAEHFPIRLKELFSDRIENNVSKYIIPNCSVEEFKEIFEHENLDNFQNNELVAQLANEHNLLHRAVSEENYPMVKFLLHSGANVNEEDCYSCTPMYYALKNKNKILIQTLSKFDGRVIALVNDLFEILIENIKSDNVDFFHLIFHIEFKETLKTLLNAEERSVAHIAGLFNAKKCFEIMKEKFHIHVNEHDIYGVTALEYLNNVKV